MNKTTQPLIWINRFLIVIISLATGLNPLPHALAHDAPPNAKGVRVTAPPPPNLAITGDGQSLYHIDATQSTAQYKVKEKFVGGIEGSTVVGSSSGITGTLLIDTKMPANSTVGMVTVNVEQLTTDSKQRDSRLRAAYLESSLFPLATFIPEAKQALPQTFQMGVPFSFVLHGYLTIHNVTIQSDWAITLTITDNAVTGTAITQVPMSDFGVGPISIVGLLSTEDNVTLTLNFVANKEGTKAQAAPKAVTTPTANANIDFARQVKPIFEANCVGCHMVGEIGHSVYAMDTLKDVVQVANDLPIILGSGYMPPWSPSHQAPAFKDNRSLSKTELDTILNWVKAGAPVQESLDTRLKSTAAASSPIRKDRVLTMPAPYQPSGKMLDDYRCFLIDPQLPQGGFVTHSVVQPGERRVVHHVIIFQVPASARAEAEAKIAQDPQPGYECFGGTELSSSGPGAIGDSLGFWVPGNKPWAAGEGTGVPVPPGGLVVLQMHYNYAAGFYPDQTSVVLQIEPADAKLTPLRGLPLLAPVELPCPTGRTEDACRREVALTQRSPNDQRIAQLLLTACRHNIKDYAAMPAEQATSDCDWRVPFDGDIMQIGGHMHTLGTSLRVVLNPDSAKPVILQDLPAWDFNWQGAYSLEQPISAKKGDILRITCTWDNSKGIASGQRNARYLTWGEGTGDEMCLNVVRIKPNAAFEHIAGLGLSLGMLNLPVQIPTWLLAVVGGQAFLGNWVTLALVLLLMVGGIGIGIKTLVLRFRAS